MEVRDEAAAEVLGKTRDDDEDDFAVDNEVVVRELLEDEDVEDLEVEFAEDVDVGTRVGFEDDFVVDFVEDMVEHREEVLVVVVL